MEILADLTLIFTLAAIMLLLMDKYNHPSIPGYIIAGLLAGTLISGDDLLYLVQIGIAFLVFIFGLKYNPKNLRSEASATLNTAIIQITITGSIGFLMGTLLGFTTVESIYFATAAAIGSSLVGLQLTEKEIHTNLLHGRLTESIQFIQDMVAFAIIAVALSTTLENMIAALIYSGIIITTAILIRDHLFGYIAKLTGGNHELLTMASLSLLIGFIGISELLDISMAVGAFAAGIAASKFPYNVELLDTMGSIKDFFAAIFFVVIGALVTIPNQTVLAASTALILTSVIIAPAVTYYTLKAYGYDNRTSLLTGLSLDQISELSLILAIQGWLLNIISTTVFETIILAAVGTMILSSYTKRYEEKIYQALAPQRNQRKSYIMEDHIIVVGYDIKGKKIVRTLKEENIEDFIVIDNDPEKISELKEKDIKCVYGDIMDRITWEEANSKKANLIISTVPSIKVSESILELDSEAEKIVRAENPQQALQLIEKGALHAAVPDMAAAEKLAENIKTIIEDKEQREKMKKQNIKEFRQYLNE